ncbi:MAG: TetR/AcrR family transcriptional regulator [Sarcina sp.]|nr:TetR/AcrR family transcriptional regulator [Sarcina sp.]
MIRIKTRENIMSEYTAARNRTRARIERAFWDLYLEKKFRRVTVREIVQRAGIHRSTFYIYFEAVEDIFSAIKKRQLSLLEEVLAAEGEGEDRFIGLLNSLREVYEENRIFLKPLVIDYHSSSFSRAYRQILKNALKKDGNLPDYPEGSSEYIILDSVMSGYIEMLLQLLDSGVLSMKEAFRFAYYTMENGTKPALQKQFGIS